MAQIAEEISATFPDLLGAHHFNYLDAFKYTAPTRSWAYCATRMAGMLSSGVKRQAMLRGAMA